jgi:hypothetical protein
MVELLLGRLSSLGRPSPALAERLRRDAAEMRETMPVRYVNNPAPRCRTLRVGRVQLRWQRDATVAALTVERLGRGYRLVGGKADD